MPKDYFQQSINLMNELRSQHFKYAQYLEKGKYKLKQKFFGKGKKHYDFDINSQQYFHEEINDISFETSETQEHFFELLNEAISQPLNVNSKRSIQQSKKSSQTLEYPLSISNPSECRVLLSKHFYSRIYNLKYKKYLLLQRYHNIQSQDKQNTVLPFIQSRISLIDKQIQSAINRSVRLAEDDSFQQSFTCAGKPVPISQTGQPIYKYLDEQQCWYSNIARDDIIVFTRNSQFLRQTLGEAYFMIQSEMKAIVMKDGLQVLLTVEEDIEKGKQTIDKNVSKMAENFNSLIERQLQVISPGNLVEKQNLTNFGYTIFGMLSSTPLSLPLYPAIYPELLIIFNKAASLFFQNLNFSSHQQIISLLPKLNSFCQIIFKYQNKQILEGKKEIKLGLEDDIDVKKQLNTMLEELWVKKHVKLHFERFEYKMQIKKVDWPLEAISEELIRQKQRIKNKNNQLKLDTSTSQLINLLTFTDFQSFRRHLKKRAQRILQRSHTKFADMEQINHYNKKSQEKMTLQELSQLFKIKFDKKPQQQPFLKPTSQQFFIQIMKKHWIVNASQIQIEETIKILKIREQRLQIINVLNGLRCYHRNLCLDLRVLTDQEFKFRLDDEFLINSNKQVVENFEKAIKETATYFSGKQEETKEKIGEQFKLPEDYCSRKMLYKKDIVECKYFGKEDQEEMPHILVANGSRPKSLIIYGIVLSLDLSSVQQRILMTATKIINKYQRYIKITSRQEIVDRVQLLRILFQFELKFLLSKLRLVEKYYFLYQNTFNLLDAFKLSQIIVQLVYRQPDISLDDDKHLSVTFQHVYQNLADQLDLEENILDKLIQKLKNQEQIKVESFHQRYCELSKIPLSAQVYLYRDIESKEKHKNRLQRLNSISSKLSSKSSKAVQQKNNVQTGNQIRQEFDQQDSMRNEDSFDIQNYDEYLLKKDMDAIFDDMIQVDQNKETLPVNTAAQQNIVVNPRFEGGPHPYNYVCEEVKITSSMNEMALNFYQSLAFAGNVRRILESLNQQFNLIYGYVSKTYQSFLVKTISKFMKDILLQSPKPIKRWNVFQSHDFYHQIVTQSSKHYLELMSAAIDPPSNIQMAITSTLDKHQQKLPLFNVLSVLDYYSIESLICLKKPINIASYRQLALGINFLTYLNIRQSLFHIQLKRERLMEAYQKLANNCDSIAERFGSMYTRTGQSDIFLSAQELRIFKEQNYNYPVFPEVLQQLKSLLYCEHADLQLFQTVINSTKIKLEDLVIMKNQVGKDFMNTRFDNSRLLAKDQKTLKMIKSRLATEISVIFSDQFKKNSFLKIKEKIKVQAEKLIKQVTQADVSQKLTFPKEKISEYSKSLLQDKLKRKLIFEVIDCYRKDLIQTEVKNRVFVQTDSILKRIHKLIECAPYLKKIFVLGSNDQNLTKKIFYDQKKKTQQNTAKISRQKIEDTRSINSGYIYSRQQLCDQWWEQDILYRCNNLNNFSIHSIVLNPPHDKLQLFKWLYNIPDYGLSEYEQKAIHHFIGHLCLPFTGKSSQSQYMQSPYVSEPPRNRFLSIYEHYLALLEYLEMNYLLVILQSEDETLQSILYLLQNDNIVFEDLFPLKDEVTIHESLAELENNYLKTCFNYKQNRQEDKQKINAKIDAKGLSKAKSHKVVYDEVLDFIISKVEGRGVIRENFLPLAKQLEKTLSFNHINLIDFLKKKTQKIHYLLNLATIEAYLNQQHQEISNQQFSHYLFPLHKWFLNNELEFYRLISPFSNPRMGLSKVVKMDQRESLRFLLGVFTQNNARTIKTASIVERYKAVIMINSIDLDGFLRNHLAKRLLAVGLKRETDNQNNSNISNQPNNSLTNDKKMLQFYNFNFLPSGVTLFNSIGQHNRLKIFSRMRYYYQKVADYIKIKPNIIKEIQIEETELNYIKFMFSSKIQSLGAVIFTAQPNFPVSAKSFKEISVTLKEMIEKNTFTIFDQLEQYKAQNKIQFGKSDQKLLAITDDIKKNQKLANIYNKLIREVINAKLTRQEFKSRVLMESIRLLKNQKIHQVQSKKIINTSLIPRVHLIASYSSPLVLERKTYISQQYKLAFAQAFINRFRNKVSRVDLLSSGYGFVITVPDLQDCVNFMNKLLFTFAQKQFKYRLQTSQQYFEIMMEGVNEKNKIIQQQEEIISYLKQKVQNIMQAEYLGKVTRLLHQKTVIQDKLREVEQSTKGLEDRIRKTVEIQYQKKISTLQAENEILKNRFNEFKSLFVTLTKDSAKNNFLQVANTIRDKIGDLLNKRIDVKEAFVTNDQGEINKKLKIVKEQQLLIEKKGEIQINSELYTASDLQKCALGQDIIHDPYYTTKLIQKMRLFNIFKLGSKKIYFDHVEQKKTSQLKQLHKIQDTVIVQSQRQILIREELKKTQQELSRKVSELEKIKQSYEVLENERTKLKILLTGKDKKIEQKEREALQNIKKLMEIEKLPTLAPGQSKVEKVLQQKQKPKLSEFRNTHRKKSIRMQKSPFVTSIPFEQSVSAYDRFELSNKDTTWRQKCEQLYIENKKLLTELQKAHSALTTPTRDGYSLNLRQRKNSDHLNHANDHSVGKKEQVNVGKGEKRFPNLGFKYNIMKQTG